MMNLEIEIGELRLEGFTQANGAAVQAVIERELMRLIAADGLPAGWQRGIHIPAASPINANLPPTATADQIGTSIARSIYGSSDR